MKTFIFVFCFFIISGCEYFCLILIDFYYTWYLVIYKIDITMSYSLDWTKLALEIMVIKDK